jgi:drug/metabolite transporter (DMT)-like permease
MSQAAALSTMPVSNPTLSRRAALALFAIVIFTWGFNWTVTKLILQHGATPLWTIAIRSAIAAMVLLPLLMWRGELIVPRRGDWAVVISIGVLHMTAFAALVGLGISLIPAGRSIVLGYTTPLWVAPGAALFLRERLSRMQVVGVALGIAGLALIFNPVAFDWSDQRALLGNALILIAAFCWAASILHVRAHKWVSTPFQLVFWEVLLATILLIAAAFAVEGTPHIRWGWQVAALFFYGGVFGVALAYWAMAMVNRSLPAVTTSLGILATPVVGVLSAVVALGEGLSLPLLGAMLLIGGGIALGTLEHWKRQH